MKTVRFRTRSFENANEVIIKIQKNSSSRMIALRVFCFTDRKIMTSVTFDDRDLPNGCEFTF